MYLYPAIDLVDGKAVRLYKGDYAQMTVYSDDPVSSFCVPWQFFRESPENRKT